MNLTRVIVGLVAGFRTFEAPQKKIVDIDGAPLQLQAQIIGLDLHKSGQRQQVELLLMDQPQNLHLLLRLVCPCKGQVGGR